MPPPYKLEYLTYYFILQNKKEKKTDAKKQCKSSEKLRGKSNPILVLNFQYSSITEQSHTELDLKYSKVIFAIQVEQYIVIHININNGILPSI